MHLLPRTSRVGALALGASLLVSLAACGDDSDVEDGSGGATSSSGDTTGATAPTTDASSSSSTGEGGSPDGSGGTGGQGTGGHGTGGGGTGGTGGGGTGGTGGGTSAWAAPACDAISGAAAVTFTTDENDTIAPRDASLSGVAYAMGIVALETPNVILASADGTLLRSEDAGCTFEEVGALPSTYATLVAAGDGAYGFSIPDAVVFSIEGDTITTLDKPGDPKARPVALAAERNAPEHVRLVLEDGSLWDSASGGQAWDRLGESAAPDACFYTAAIDPNDFDHILCGTIETGTWVTRNAGGTWDRADSDVLWSQTFSITISPVDGDVVWIEGFENGLHEGEVVGIDQRHVWRSTDGGETFTTVFVEGADVTGDGDTTDLYNGNLLAAHPTDVDVLYYTFGSPPLFGPNVAELFRVEASTGDIHVETQMNGDIDDYGAMTFNPADPTVIYFSLSSERSSEG